MLQLKFTAPLDQVHVCLVLTNPLTGKLSTIDAKVDTGSAVTLIPKAEILDLELDSILPNYKSHLKAKKLHFVSCN